MEAHKKDMSLLFYKHLCDVIGTKNVVKKRREIFQTTDRLINLQNRDNIQISSGSKAEGLDLPGSDFDVMKILKYFIVHENVNLVDNQILQTQMLMETADSKPGFTKLKIVHTTLVKIPFCQYCDNNTYFSSDLLKKSLLRLDYGNEYHIHGPCLSTRCDAVDLAVGVHCKEWVSQAHGYIVRTKHSWASDNVIENILYFGVSFVPIASKGSLNPDLEWRMSFSFAEKLLIWSFNHVQLLCYALLKILLKEVIKKMVPVTYAGLLCSYFIKTIMFWLCEETDVSQWRPDNMLACYSTAFKRLIYCVENKTCLHYFIPENNLFEDRFSDEEYRTLLQTLKELWEMRMSCLLATELLRSFSCVLNPSLSYNVPTKSFITFMPIALSFAGSQRSIDAMKYFVYTCVRSSKQCVGIYLLSYNNQVNAHNIISQCAGFDSNKKKYRRFKQQMCYLLISVNHDSIYGWLSLASFFETNKHYLKCKYLVEACLRKCQHGQCLISLHDPNTVNQHVFNEIRRKLHPHKNTDLLVCKHFTVTPIDSIGSILTEYSRNQRGYFISPVVIAHYLYMLCDRPAVFNEFENKTVLVKVATRTKK